MRDFIIRARDEGWGYARIAQGLGITKARVQQIVREVEADAG
jgi:hypothetical protein